MRKLAGLMRRNLEKTVNKSFSSSFEFLTPCPFLKVGTKGSKLGLDASVLSFHMLVDLESPPSFRMERQTCS